MDQPLVFFLLVIHYLDLVILYYRKYLYKISIVIYYTTTAVATVPTTNSVYKIQ